ARASTKLAAASLQRVDHQPAQQLWVEVGALSWHAFAMRANSANVFHRSRHDQGGQRELTRLKAGGRLPEQTTVSPLRQARRRPRNESPRFSDSSCDVKAGSQRNSRCVGSTTRPGSFIPTNIMNTKFAGWLAGKAARAVSSSR